MVILKKKAYLLFCPYKGKDLLLWMQILSFKSRPHFEELPHSENKQDFMLTNISLSLENRQGCLYKDLYGSCIRIVFASWWHGIAIVFAQFS